MLLDSSDQKKIISRKCNIFKVVGEIGGNHGFFNLADPILVNSSNREREERFREIQSWS